MRSAWVVLALGLAWTSAGCGRVDFAAHAGADAGGSPFVEPSGVLDPTFGTGGLTLTPMTALRTELAGLVLRTHGGYLATGVHDSNNGNQTHFGLFAYTADGALDNTFGTGGVRDLGPTQADYNYAAARIDGQRIALVGDGDDGSGQDDVTVGVVDEAGAPSAAFGSAGFVRLDVGGAMLPDTSNNVAVVGDSLVACGAANYPAADSHFLLARYDFTGAPVATFGTAGIVVDDLLGTGRDECLDVVPRPGGGVFASGFSGSMFVVAAYDDRGARVPSFGGGSGYTLVSGANGFAQGLAIVDGELVAVGADDTETVIVRLTLDGELVTTFGDAGILHLPSITELDDVVAQPNGKFVAVGIADDEGIVARFMPDGSFDPAFGTAGIVRISPSGDRTALVTVQLDGNDLVVLGRVDAPDAVRSVIARLR